MLESTFLEDWDEIETKMAKKAICCLKVALIRSLSVFKGLRKLVSKSDRTSSNIIRSPSNHERTNSLHLAQKYARMYVLERYLFLEARETIVEFQREKQCFRHEPLPSTQRKANSNMYTGAYLLWISATSWLGAKKISSSMRSTFQCVFFTFIRPRRVRELQRVRDQVGGFIPKTVNETIVVNCSPRRKNMEVVTIVILLSRIFLQY